MLTTQKQIRESFWQGMPAVWSKYRNKRQNAWPCDLRIEFCDYVEMLRRDGHISESLAETVTG